MLEIFQDSVSTFQFYWRRAEHLANFYEVSNFQFCKNLGAHITPEWRKQYIQYEEMKAMLCVAQEEAPSAEVMEPEVLQRYYNNFDEKFFTLCETVSPLFNFTEGELNI